ncbi:MAG: hypothetical protein H8D78_20130 [Chloroflexi bacterium]|nr:hypothetical protein [Chloroflexota bacterium]
MTTGEDKLRRAVKHMRRPQWLRTRLNNLQAREQALSDIFNHYDLQRAKAGPLHVEPAVLTTIQEIREELDEIHQERQSLLAGYQLLQDTAEHAEL